MSTAPQISTTEGIPTVTPAPVTAATVKKENAVETFFTKFGEALKDIQNVAVNEATAELPVIDPLLPPAKAAEVNSLVSFAAQQVAAVDAKYAQIGASSVPYTVKAIEAAAVSGEGVLAFAAKLGLTITTDLPTFLAAAAQIAASLNLSTATETPTTPAA